MVKPKPLSRQIKTIEKRERKGQLGQWRREFCSAYPGMLAAIRQHVQQSLTAVLSEKGERISCKKGCTYCCQHYVTVSLAHGIAIADFLYNHAKLLRQFISNYERWQARGHSLAADIDQQRLQAQARHVPVARILADTRPLSNRYRAADIACPFLADESCLIYAVRPLSCSGHFATTPPAYCASGSARPPAVHHLIPEDGDLVQMARIADARLLVYELSLPIMVHRLLHEGSAVLMDESVAHDANM